MNEEGRIVRIDWQDPHSVDEWTPVSEQDWSLTKLVTSVGRLVKETSEAYVLSLNYASDDSTASCSMVIPKSCVKRIETINGE